MSAYWTALAVLNQVAGELGLKPVATIAGNPDLQVSQLLALLNSAGNELLLYYPWEQLKKEWTVPTQEGVDAYTLPDDWEYAVDSTQWDRSNHWPLLGPKTPQEWAYLKGSLVAPLPRIRWRIANNKFLVYPTPAPGVSYTLTMEYVRKTWIIHTGASGEEATSMITDDGDLLEYSPWLLIKFVKFKFYELKGFSTTGVNADFMRVFNNLTGKDVGSSKLSMAPIPVYPYIGPWSVPDGNWNVST